MKRKELYKSYAIVIGLYLISIIVVIYLHSVFPKDTKLINAAYISGVIVSAVMLLFYCLYLVSTNNKREIQNLESNIDSMNIMAILWTTDFEYIHCNPMTESLLGYTETDLKENEDNLHMIFPEDAFKENMQAMINNCVDEFFCNTKDGNKVCTVWTTSLVKVYKKRGKEKYLLLSIGPDLTEQSNMKQELIRYSKELADTENKYELSMELSEIGIVLKEPGATNFYVSEQLRKMFGFEDEYVSSADFRSVFHPKDRIIFDSFSGIMVNGTETESHSVEFRAITPDMTYHWFQFRYKVIPNKSIIKASFGGAIIDVTADKQKDELIEKMAYVDDVTQIYNRNRFMMLGDELLRSFMQNRVVDYWIMVIDVDSFHLINDTCGYVNGNKVLSDVAAIITANLTDGGFAARIGGDNFAVILRDNGNEDLPVEYLDKLQKDLESIHSEMLETQTVTCSLGYCKLSDGGNEFAEILDHAEFALSLGDEPRHNIKRYDNSIHEKVIRSGEIERELAKAIDNHELTLYYQPKIDLSTGDIMGMEALIRWVKPDGRIVPPCDFIPVAEKSLLITKISHFVLYEACRQNKAWQDMGLRPVTVSINLTAIDFYQTNVTDIIKDALASTGLDPQWLDVELTESLALKDIDHAIAQMNEIKALGVKLSMDDFGTGYSSLSYIQVLPISLLKLDRSFIMYLEEDEISREIVSAVIRIAKSKKIETIAEGIETAEQASILRNSGCDWAQGYYFGKPMPKDKFEEFLAQNKVDISSVR